MELLRTLLTDPATFLTTAGYLGITAVVFAESGLFFGFFLPGDSLLFSAGLLASQGIFSLPLLSTLIVIAAILGDSVGYWFGRKAGPAIFSREDSFFFHKKHAERTKVFYEKHGAKTLILARFVPIIRTYAPILAGVGSMNYSLFLRYNILGGLLWGLSLPLLGYFLGKVFPASERYLSFIIIAIILVSFVPILKEIFFAWREKKAKVVY